MCNPAHCPMKCLVLAYSTIVTISMSRLISLLLKSQTVNPSPGAVTGGKLSLALTRELNLDTLSSDSSEEEIRDSGSSFYSLIVRAVIYIFHILENIDHCQGEKLIYINMYAPVSYWQVHAYCCHTGLSISAPLPLW